MLSRPGFIQLIPLLIGGIASLVAGAASVVGAVGGAALSTIGTAGGAVLSTAGTLGGGAISTVGQVGGGALSLAGKTASMAGQAAAGGIGVLGGVPAAATTTIDTLGALMPTVIGGIEAYRSITGEEPAGPAEYRAPGAAPAQPAPVIMPLQTLGGQQAPIVMTTPGPPAAEPNYLLYAGIALAAIILLRNK